ncbi:carbamoyltransferase [Thermodesulfobacteriota bacterium]
MKSILGISSYYHDSAAALLVDGQIIAAAQQERFSRKKHDSSFPVDAVRYVLDDAGLRLDDLEAVAFYDKPFLKFERLLDTYHAFAPRGLKSFLSAIPIWIKEKIFMRKMLDLELKNVGRGKYRQILFPEHHLSHAASAFYPSPFKNAAIITVDGVGEWATTTICSGENNGIEILYQMDFPHSLGLLYSAFTYFCGFKVNSGEYKLMGLAPYGNAHSDRSKNWKQKVLDHIIDIREDGSFLLDMKYFDFATGLTMCNEKKWEALFGICKRKPEAEITQEYMDLAWVIQQVTEEVLFKLVDTAYQLTGKDYLTMAGGVALNCVANGKLIRQGPFKDCWFQPAAGDAGGALGAAYAAWHIWKGCERSNNDGYDAMKGAYLGPMYSTLDVHRIGRKYGATFVRFRDFEKLCSKGAEILSEGKVLGWFQGRMEFGPRALGNRSILGDPRHPEMQKKLNLKIKYREGFRPFAPSVLEEDIETYFDLTHTSPYMLLVAPVKDSRRNPLPEDYNERSMFDRLYHLRSDIPAVTHVDYSARIQSVNRETNPRYWKLINAFKDKTGYGVIVNTSFNVRGEPIVCTPEEAYICFMRTEMDHLVIEDCLFDKVEQPEFQDAQHWENEFELD